MACVTLKRPLPLDTTFEPRDNGNKSNAASPAQQFPPTKRRRCNSREADESGASAPNAFPSVSLDAESIAEQLRAELRRLRRRSGNNGGSADEPMEDAQALRVAVQALSTHGSQSCGMAANMTANGANKEKPVFTLRQMSLICERVCKDRLEGAREEYNKILQQKLSEQYDAFVKFIDHQIHQRFEQSQHHPSYLS